MKLVIDLQALQGSSLGRGIGRYSTALTKAMVQEAGDRHEIILALNAFNPQTIASIRQQFADLLAPERIRVWRSPMSGNWLDPSSIWRIRPAEALREHALASLGADAIHISSMMEGIEGKIVTSIGALDGLPPTGSMLYDLTPLAEHAEFLASPPVRAWYQDKLRHLRRSRLCLAISESARREGIELLGLPPERIVNISAAADPHFTPRTLMPAERRAIALRHGLTRPFILYYGGFDPHKNAHRLVEAFAMLPAALRSHHQLLLVGKFYGDQQKQLEEAIVRAGLNPEDVRLLGRVDDDALLDLLHCCTLAIYPSLREGFGLPVLEAMASGAAVICSNTTSLPEVIGRTDAMFDPRSVQSISGLLETVLKNASFRASLQAYGPERAKSFSWKTTARRALEAYEALHEEERHRAHDCRPVTVRLPKRPKLAWLTDWPLSPARAEGLNFLSNTYDIDLLVDGAITVSTVVGAGLPVLDIATFPHRLPTYDRVVIDRADAPNWLAIYPAVTVLRAEDDSAGENNNPAVLGHIHEDENPAHWTEQAIEVIEDGHCSATSPLTLARKLAQCVPAEAGEDYHWSLAEAMAANRVPTGKPRILIDVSCQAHGHPGSGINRVVTRLVKALLESPPSGFQIELIRMNATETSMVHARRFTAALDTLPLSGTLAEDEVEPRPSDIFLALDLNHGICAQKAFLTRLRELGCKSLAVVYDLLPIQRPDWFPPGLGDAHQVWLEQISGWDRLLCISQAVAEDVRTELARLGHNPGKADWFHLGSELPKPTEGGPLPELADRPSIMLVSILWPRKGHDQALDAMEWLWNEGLEVNLVFAGRQGWGAETLVSRIRSHPQLGRRLFWFNGPDDALLARLYATVDGVIIPSEGEGFGLPLVEAIHHRRPVLARDLPVFRELVGDNVRYFRGLGGSELAESIRNWLAEIEAGQAPCGNNVALLSWRDSARHMLSAMGIESTR